MAQRIHNLSKWSHVAEGHSIHYSNPRPRPVVLEVNCPDPVCFYVLQDAEDMRRNPELVTDEAAGRAPRPSTEPLDRGEDGRPLNFVGFCHGRDRLEFVVDGAFDLLVEGGSAYVYTADSQDIATRIVAPVIFTKIANRRQRNPQMEWIEYQMRLNQDRFKQQVSDEIERRVAAALEGREQYAPERVPRKVTPRTGAEAAGEGQGVEPGPEASGQGGANATESGAGRQGGSDREAPGASDRERATYKVT